MRCRIAMAELLRVELVQQDFIAPDVMAKTSDAELLRLDRRVQRARWGNDNLSPTELQHRSRQRRRARQTHPGKR